MAERGLGRGGRVVQQTGQGKERGKSTFCTFCQSQPAGDGGNTKKQEEGIGTEVTSSRIKT